MFGHVQGTEIVEEEASEAMTVLALAGFLPTK